MGVIKTQPTIDDVPDEVKALFEKLTLTVIARGIQRFSADAILHQIRWFQQIERGDRDFKCNNNWTSLLARWFVDRHPDHEEFFELRRCKKDARKDGLLF